MKSISKIVFISTCLLLIFCITTWAQDGNVPEPDDEFNLFLMVIASLFMGGIFGAAVVGALLTALVLFFLFGAIALGAVSASVAIGLYQKSFTAGFKTFLKVFYIIACTVISSIGILLVNAMFQFELSTTIMLLSGFVSGIASGFILAAGTYKVLQMILKTVLQKLNLNA